MEPVRRIASLLLVPAMTFALVVGVSITGSAKPAPSATATPDTDLADYTGDGQYVTINWKGFPAGVDVYARQCVRGATDLGGQCSQGGLYSVCGRSCPGTTFLGPSDGDGAGSASTRVAIGTINLEPNLDPIQGQTFQCDHTQAHRCSLFVMWDVNDLAKSVEVPFTISPPLSACPQDTTGLPGAGGGPSFRRFQGWSVDVCEPPVDVGLRYTLLFSGSDAVQDLVDSAKGGFSSLADIDYATTTHPATRQQQAILDRWQTRMAYAPVTASALVFAYRLFDTQTGRQVRNLVLTPEVLARIFSRQLTTWNEPSITKLNRGLRLPGNIAVYGRGDASEETLAMTSWFAADPSSSKAWASAGVGLHPNPFAEPTDLLPSLGQISLVTGAKAIANAVALDSFDPSTFGSIGYMDSSWAALYNLPTVRLAMPNGKIVDATPQTIRAAISQMEPDTAGLLQPDYALQDSRYWPMATVSYMLAPFDFRHAVTKPSADVRDALGALLEYIATTGQEDVPVGYVALPEDLVEQTRWVAASMDTEQPLPSQTPSQTPSPTPPQSPGPTPTFSTQPPFYDPAFPPSTSFPEPPTSGTAVPSPSIAVVAPTPPLGTLQGSSSRLVLPSIAGAGLMSSLVGTGLLVGDRLRRPLRRRKRRADR